MNLKTIAYIMGDSLDHSTIGLVLTVFGIYWFCKYFYRYLLYQWLSRNVVPRVPLKKKCRWAHWLTQEFFITLCSVMGIIGEVTMGLTRGGVRLDNMKNLLIYGFFLFHGISAICLPKKVRELVPDIECLTLALAYGMEAFIFSNHLDGHTPMNRQVHAYLIYTILGCLICTLAERLYPESFMPALGRALCTTLQGTWIVIIGLVLFMPLYTVPWDQRDPNQMVLISYIFILNILGILIFYAGLGSLTWYRIQRVIRQLPKAENWDEDSESGSIDLAGDEDANTGDPIAS